MQRCPDRCRAGARSGPRRPPRPLGGALQLPAGRHDVLAPRRPHRRGVAGAVDDRPERLDPLGVRPLVGRAGPRVEGDEVDLRRDAGDQLDQPPRVGVRIVDALQHHVLEGDALGVRQPRIGPAGVEQRRDVPLAIDRHEGVAHRVRRRVEGDGEQAADLRAHAGDLGDDAARRQGDPPARQRDALAVHGDLHRVAHRVEVVERLAHAHQHDVRDQPLLVGLASPVGEVVAGDEDLADDLGGGQVAHQPLGAGVAERAGQRAPDLARHAERAAVLLGDVDGLDLVPAGDAQQVLARPVRRDLPGDDLGPLDRECSASIARNGRARFVIASKSRAPR